MTNEELLSVAAIVERATNRFHQQAADHEAKMVEHRAAFGARTKADAETIDRLHTERDALRAEVAALQERLRASIARGDLAQMEVAALMSQTSKHPVKVGEWVKRLNPIVLGSGTIAKVLSINERPPTYTVEHIDGYEEFWIISNCEPCDPPEATHAEPDLTHLHAKGKEAWSDVPNATQWVEEMRGNTEATHDTEAGKAAAESALKTEPVADEIKVWDVVEVYQATGKHTAQNDVGFIGTVGTIHLADRVAHVRSGLGMPHMVDLCDVRKVRKVTT